MKIQIALDIWINKIFHTVLCFKDMFGFHSITSLPTVCFAPVPPSWSIRIWMWKTQKKQKTINVSFEEFKGKTLSLCRAECLSQKGLEKLCEICTSWYSYFEKGCRKKCTRQSRKVLWVVLSLLFFKEIWENGTSGHGRLFVSAKGK